MHRNSLSKETNTICTTFSNRKMMARLWKYVHLADMLSNSSGHMQAAHEANYTCTLFRKSHNIQDYMVQSSGESNFVTVQKVDRKL